MKFGNLVKIAFGLAWHYVLSVNDHLLPSLEQQLWRHVAKKKSNIRGMRSKIGQQGSTQSQITSEYTLETG